MKKERMKRGKMKNKRGVAIEGLVWWVIGLAVLVIMIILAVVLRERLAGIGSYIKGLFRFRLLRALI